MKTNTWNAWIMGETLVLPQAGSCTLGHLQKLWGIYSSPGNTYYYGGYPLCALELKWPLEVSQLFATRVSSLHGCGILCGVMGLQEAERRECLEGKMHEERCLTVVLLFTFGDLNVAPPGSAYLTSTSCSVTAWKLKVEKNNSSNNNNYDYWVHQWVATAGEYSNLLWMAEWEVEAKSLLLGRNISRMCILIGGKIASQGAKHAFKAFKGVRNKIPLSVCRSPDIHSVHDQLDRYLHCKDFMMVGWLKKDLMCSQGWGYLWRLVYLLASWEHTNPNAFLNRILGCAWACSWIRPAFELVDAVKKEENISKL